MRIVRLLFLAGALAGLSLLHGCGLGQSGYEEREAKPGVADPSAIHGELLGGGAAQTQGEKEKKGEAAEAEEGSGQQSSQK